MAQLLWKPSLVAFQVLEHECKKPALADARSIIDFPSESGWRCFFDIIFSRSKEFRPQKSLADALQGIVAGGSSMPYSVTKAAGIYVKPCQDRFFVHKMQVCTS